MFRVELQSMHSLTLSLLIAEVLTSSEFNYREAKKRGEQNLMAKLSLDRCNETMRTLNETEGRISIEALGHEQFQEAEVIRKDPGIVGVVFDWAKILQPHNAD